MEEKGHLKAWQLTEILRERPPVLNGGGNCICTQPLVNLYCLFNLIKMTLKSFQKMFVDDKEQHRS
jgi:hypothetical protein